jgi:hypothetical protein
MRARVNVLAPVVLLAGILLAGCGTAAARPGNGGGHPGSGTVPSSACRARPGEALVRLSDTSPAPRVTVRTGADVAVTVPRWSWGTATDVTGAGRILREECSVTLPGGGSRTIFLAVGPGRTRLGATVQPASNLMMPAWGGEVIVSAT